MRRVVTPVRRVVWSALLGVPVVLAVAVFTLLAPWQEPNLLTGVASVAIDPGWRLALLAFPEGVHAGVPFLVAAYLANWVVYAALVGAIGFALYRPRTGRRS